MELILRIPRSFPSLVTKKHARVSNGETTIENGAEKTPQFGNDGLVLLLLLLGDETLGSVNYLPY